MKRISQFFYRISTGWVVLTALLIFMIFSALTMPGETKRSEQYSKGTGSPDTHLFYSGSQLSDMAEIYGEDGRTAYIEARWTFDLAFPFVYTFFYLTGISFLLKKSVKEESWLRMFNLMPFLGLVFDLAENTAASSVMAAYPNQNLAGLMLAPLFTPIKWFFVALSMILAVVLFLIWILKSITGSQKYSV